MPGDRGARTQSRPSAPRKPPRKKTASKGRAAARVKASRQKTPRVDIGIVTVRDDEFEAVLDAFPEKDGIFKKRREYTLRWADAGTGDKYRVAILRQIEQGNGEAQDAARDLLDDLKPSLLLIVGIAGGLPSDDFTLGDVVLSTRVNDYSVEARKEGADPTYSVTGGPIAKSIAAGIANLAGRSDELGDWDKNLRPMPEVSWSKKGQVYGPASWKKEVIEKLEFHFGANAESRPRRFIAGVIASSDRLVKDPIVLFPWIQTARHLLAVEMESGGVYRAARDRCPMLAIRGISDIIGLKRANEWTKYACSSAASFARAYLKTTPVPPRTPTAPTATPIDEEEVAPTNPAEANEGTDVLYANLIPLRQFPETIYIAPATSDTHRRCWAILRKGADSRVPEGWLLHNKSIYSLTNPENSRLSLICDTGAIEEHQASNWAKSKDSNERYLFAQLLNGALREDLDVSGVWYFWREDLYAFAGRPSSGPRKVEYRNLRQRSKLTVVAHYQTELKDGTTTPYLRHLAFRGRFRVFDGLWYLEVTPTYRFTSDGKKKYRFHEQQLKGIKRIEKNRAVLSQLLVWGSVLRGQSERKADDRPMLLVFDEPPTFKLDAGMTEDDWRAAGDNDISPESDVFEDSTIPTEPT